MRPLVTGTLVWGRGTADAITTAGCTDRGLAPNRTPGASAGAAHLRVDPPGRPLRPIAGRARGRDWRRRAHPLPSGRALRPARHGQLGASTQSGDAPHPAA